MRKWFLDAFGIVKVGACGSAKPLDIAKRLERSCAIVGILDEESGSVCSKR